MADQPQHINILAPESFRTVLSRRTLLQGTVGSAALAALLAACGSDSKSSTPTPTGTDAANTPATAGSGTYASGGTLAMYTWGDYNDPEIVGKLAEKELGVTMKVDFYGSNEDLITKLSSANGTSGFDIVVPTGPYIPQMIEKGLLQKLDLSKLPNLTNMDPQYLGQAWDPNNEYAVCKNWGSTGWIYDTTVVKMEINTWADFIKACQTEASGNCSILDTAPNALGMYCWANGLDWNTEDSAELDAAEKFLVDEFAQHLTAFDSYPSTKLSEGAYALSMAWNGDARQTYTRIADAGGDPSVWKWGLGAPETELWMDNYVIPVGAPNPDAAHAWINWLLTSEISIKDLEYHGYNTGIKDIEGAIAEFAPELTRGEMIFFEAAQVETMKTQVVNTAQDRQADILSKMKAKAGA